MLLATEGHCPAWLLKGTLLVTKLSEQSPWEYRGRAGHPLTAQGHACFVPKVVLNTLSLSVLGPGGGCVASHTRG